MATDVSTGRTTWTGLLVVGFFLLACAGRGQEPNLVLPSAEKLLREAYARTKAAPREADLTEIIRMCRQARRAEPSKEVAAYADQLAAWAHNRRGEQYAQQAVDLAGQDQQAKADELDASRCAAKDADPQTFPPHRTVKPLRDELADKEAEHGDD